MTTISIKEARKTLGTLVEKARCGKPVVLTRRGRLVAQISKVSSQRPSLPSLRSFRSAIKAKGTSLSDTIIANRVEARFDVAALRTLDALHLAVAYEFGGTMVTADAGQAKAARQIGIEVIMP